MPVCLHQATRIDTGSKSNFARMATDATKRKHYCKCKHFPTLSLTWLSLAWPQCKPALNTIPRSAWLGPALLGPSVNQPLLVTTAAYQGKFHFSTTAGMRRNDHGKFKVQRFKFFEKIKKDDCAPSPTLPHIPLHQWFPTFFISRPHLKI